MSLVCFQGLPALCYAVNNRLFFYTLQYVDGGTFQILSNLKIMTTLLWSVLLLRKSFSPAQWGACVLLTLGAMLVHGDNIGSIIGYSHISLRLSLFYGHRQMGRRVTPEFFSRSAGCSRCC